MLDKMDDDRPTALRDRDGPLTRNRSGPRGAGNTAMACSKADQLSGSSKTSEKLASRCVFSTPNSKLRRGAAGSPSSDDK